MTTKYYRCDQGIYLGGWTEDHPDIPAGAVEVSVPPPCARCRWVDGAWDTSVQVYTNWEDVRADRKIIFDTERWRFNRNAREQRLSLTPTEDIVALDTYYQALADLPQTYATPEEVVFPTPPWEV